MGGVVSVYEPSDYQTMVKGKAIILLSAIITVYTMGHYQNR